MKNLANLVGKLKTLYSQNINLIEYLNNRKDCDYLSRQDKICLSYDIQAGSYTKGYNNSQFIREINSQSGKKIAKLLEEISPSTVLDAGTGEATSLADVLLNTKDKNIKFAAFDISISRLLYAKLFLEGKNLSIPHLFTSDLTQISLAENSVDLIMTRHAIEPNGGMEDVICQELYRVTRKYVLLIEPSWEFGSDEQRERMVHHGYIKDLPGALERTGFKILNHEPWDKNLNPNPLNIAALILAKKSTTTATQDADFPDFKFAYPSSNFLLKNVEDGFYCQEMGVLFPVVQNIACLLKNQALLVTRYLEITENNEQL
ncbi:MAG: class I SAM-dependent methyltransferase [Okeania sp. SIO3I5]|uniref:class I SAM-dependent methyltransferase n=1 Tax=Okeania sp. SIO3I5 TaxID=2607805 RepID=UPI0013BAFCCF|nr:class I SAM-dependent methyltransferase [Okeania sp. SIO3I5]NEQ36712.1 class I SAM-dependent methyltransferase [Okeania sp. SIO3I5]